MQVFHRAVVFGATWIDVLLVRKSCKEEKPWVRGAHMAQQYT